MTRLPLLMHDEFRMRKDGGGVFFDLGVHMLDMAWSLLGFPQVQRVVAANHTVFPEWNVVRDREEMAEDNSFALLFFEGDTAITVEVSYASQRPETSATGHHRSRLTVFGGKGGLEIPSLEFTSGGRTRVKTRVLATRKAGEKDERLLMLSNFADAVHGKCELAIKPEHGAQLMKMLEAVVESGKRGKEIWLNG
jgi:predicted dehydrogenase